MKIRYMLAALLFCLILSGCENTGNSERDSSFTADADLPEASLKASGESSDSEPERELDHDRVWWAVPKGADISPEHQDRINELLWEKYGLGVEFIQLEDHNIDDYHKSLETVTADIAFAGFDTDYDKPCERLIASGYFEPLDDMIEGSSLKAHYPQQLWECVKNGDKIYTLPNELKQDQGFSIVFDLDQIPADKARSFDGDITKLKEMLGESGKLFFDGDNSFVNYFGCSYSNGLIITPEGKAESITDNAECMKWLRELNSLYNDGRISLDPGTWRIALWHDSPMLEKTNVVSYTAKAVISPIYSATTGIVSSSPKKDKAFRLLEIIHTDSELANLLVYGTDYKEKDGFAVDENDEPLGGFTRKMIFGLEYDLLRIDDNLAHFDTSEDRQKYYDEKTVLSPLIGLDISQECKEINSVVMQYKDLWKSNDFEKDAAEFREKLNDAGVDSVCKSISMQIKDKTK
ncbi:MAG: hypothetical protein IKH78_05980 [Ruminococcus sp.]|nr:hypothetical protein [Ruminococcus sp.]